MIYYIIYYFAKGGTIFLLIYLDNAATTRPKYLDIVKEHYNQGWFNPSSGYSGAADVFSDIKKIRQKLSDVLGLDSNVIFTSGGTEANNLAINSAKKAKAHYITSTIEHPSVYSAFKQLEQNGASVDYVKPRDFCVRSEDVAELVRDNTALVSIMHVNNETGALNDIRKIAAAVKAKNSKCLFHSDGVQALKKTQISLEGAEIDFYTVSAHKIHGLKGTGSLLTKKTSSIKPLVFGGGQEEKLRPGTENTLGIQVFGEALKHFNPNHDKVTELREKLIVGLDKIDGARVNVPDSFVPNIVSVSFEGVRAEVLVRLLGEKGIYIGAGAACSRGKLSRVLLESGIERKMAEGTVRISMSEENTNTDIDTCLVEINAALSSLRRFHRN